MSHRMCLKFSENIQILALSVLTFEKRPRETVEMASVIETTLFLTFKFSF